MPVSFPVARMSEAAGRRSGHVTRPAVSGELSFRSAAASRPRLRPPWHAGLEDPEVDEVLRARRGPLVPNERLATDDGHLDVFETARDPIGPSLIEGDAVD